MLNAHEVEVAMASDNAESFRTSLTALVFLLVLSTLLYNSKLYSQPATQDDSTIRQRAFELMNSQKPLEALPLLEKLAEENPSDRDVLVRLGAALVASAVKDRNTESRKATYRRAHKAFAKAKELGDSSDYVLRMLEEIPESGDVPLFSSNGEIDAAMRDGEEAFASGDLVKALEAYQRVLAADSQNYEASLFTGDVYFRMDQMDKAREWFARAIKANANRETAYRYMADALMKEGNVEAAREMYIDAVVAEPYLQGTWISLARWAQSNGKKLVNPKIEFPNVIRRVEKNGETTFEVDAAAMLRKDGTKNWVAYEATRFAWACDRFTQAFPLEKEYRHTLREETEALNLVAKLVSDEIKDNKIDQLDPAIAVLLKIRDEGLMEAYVLISRPDRGIAVDCPAYRAGNRDKLHRYIADFVISENKAKN